MLLKKGDKGVQVSYLQYGLHIMCCSPNGFDGDFGAGTEAAVKKYQKKYGLSVDGQVGDATWNNLVGEIKIIQRALSQKNYYRGYIDGIAGSGTYNAVIAFQKANSLSADGQVGDITRAKLMNGNSSNTGNSGFPLKQGSKGDNVLYLQYGLHIMCCSPGSIDGDFGTGTENAVRKFQSKYSLSVDGIVGTGTWSKLQTLIKEIQNALVRNGYSTNGIDGIAGPATYEAVISFQRANGLSVDGQVGPATRAKLLGNPGDGGTDSFPLKQGSKGPYVLYLQNGLWISCINPNGRDGDFGAGTASAVRLFQSRYGLSVDGVVGTATWEKLRSVIRPIQQSLVNHGYNTGGIDGIAGENTYSAVIAFQKANGLTPDGMVGSATKDKLGITGNGGGSGTTSATLRVGSNGSLTKYLQRMLNVLGYSVSVDGVFGEGTKNAVLSFQNKYGLSADGIVGSGTWKKLFSVYKVPVSGTGVQKMVNVARHELSWGFAEDNSNNITPYGEWYGIQGGAWCAMFVSWCAYQAGILNSKVPSFAYCPSGVNAYRAKGKFYSRSGGYTPKVGDTIFFWNSADGVVGHTGIVTGVSATGVTTIEGNATDAVREKWYSRTNTYIHGYGCNDGIGTPEEPDPVPSQKEINKVLVSKWWSLLEATGNDDNILLNIAAENFNRELEIFRSSNIRITTEFSSETKLFKECRFKHEFNVTNGTIMFGGDSALGGIESTFGIPKDAMQPLVALAMEVGDGKGKIEVGAAFGNWITISYAVQSEVEVTEYYNHAFSYKYTIYIKPTEPSEGGMAEPGLVVNDLMSYFTTAVFVVGGFATFYLLGAAAKLVGGVLAEVVGEILGVTEFIKQAFKVFKI